MRENWIAKHHRRNEITPVGALLAKCGMAYLQQRCTHMLFPNHASRIAGNRHYLYIPGTGWTATGTTLTGTMANTGVVTGGDFSYTVPTGTVETYQITWVTGGALVTAFAIGFDRALTAAERTALGQASFWAALFAGTAVVVAECTAGNDYYVDATSGSDAAAGTLDAPWKTLAKVNAASFTAGDRINLKRGEVWRETLTPPASSIRIGAYGTGDKPEISGALHLKGEWYPSWDLLGNGSFEGWSNSSTPTNWSKNVAGTCTITQEATTVKNGNYALKMSIDASNNSVDINQISAAGANATEYSFSFWHKIPVGKSAMYRIRSQASGNYLRTDLSWGAVQDHVVNGTGEWTQEVCVFTSEATTTTFRPYIYRNSAASSDLYFDKVSFVPTTPPAADNIWHYAIYLTPGRLHFDGVPGTKVAALGDLTEEGEWYTPGGNIFVYSETEPSTNWTAPGIEKPHNLYAAVIDVDYVVLDNLHLTKALYYNVHGAKTTGAVSTGCIVRDCLIDYADASGLQMGTGTIGDYCENWVIRSSTISYNGSAVDATTDHGIYISHSSGNIIEDCTLVENVAGWAIQIQDAANNNIVRRCVMTDNAGGGVVIYNDGDGMPTGNLIHSNLITGGGATALINLGGALTEAANSIYNNTLANGAAKGVNLGNGSTLNLKNNIIWGCADEAFQGGPSLVSDYNLVGPEATGFISYDSTSYDTLAAYVAASSKDAHSLKTDPLFVGATDFSLQAGSPAINAGVAIAGITEDILRHAFSGVPDIGAYERVA